MPTIYPAPFPGTVLAPGDLLAVTRPQVPPAGPPDLVGRDLDPAGRKGVLVGGAANLQNALLRRLQTPVGYLPHRPEYGSRVYAYLGAALDLATVVALRQEVARTLSADPRVLAIKQLSVDVAGDQLLVKAQLQTVLGLLGFGGAVAPVGA